MFLEFGGTVILRFVFAFSCMVDSFFKCIRYERGTLYIDPARASSRSALTRMPLLALLKNHDTSLQIRSRGCKCKCK
jgi:hypothetical protein